MAQHAQWHPTVPSSTKDDHKLAAFVRFRIDAHLHGNHQPPLTSPP